MISFFTIFGLICFYLIVFFGLFVIISIWLERQLHKRELKKAIASKPIHFDVRR